MKLPIYQVDAFANKPFEGNPAAVIPLETWLTDDVMQSIAEENNLSETVFFVKQDSGFKIRWFTPCKEVKLCGHATLAAAYVLFDVLGYKEKVVNFDSLSGKLSVSQKDGLITLNFPSQIPVSCDIPEDLIKGLGKKPVACLKSEDYIAVFDSEEELAEIVADHTYLKRLDLRGVVVTSVSHKYDYVARCFAPKYDIPEDAVTGSAYTQLSPYWSTKMLKNKFTAKQISKRGGELFCELKGERVLISGKAVMYLQGEIEI
ncbi:MAG: PhzF family phenazine biosynthesis protein [Gammaproteobacteria bacterium]|nr:PhzF family phenazine biosynthesis protein [Gammaproteobacteria bacterium]